MAQDRLGIVLTIQGLGKFRLGAKRAEDAIEGVKDEVEQLNRASLRLRLTNFALTSSIIKSVKAFRDHAKAIGDSGGVIQRANTVFAFFRNVMRVLVPPATITAVTLLTQAASALVASGVALGSALAPLSGYLLALPAALTAAGQAMIVLKLGFEDMTQALQGSAVSLQRLSIPALGFFIELKNMQDAWTSLKTAAQEGMFPGFSKGIQAATKNYKVFHQMMFDTGKVFGTIGANFGKFFGSKAFGSDFAQIAKTNDQLFASMGRSSLTMTKAWVQMTLAAKPLTKFIGQLSESFASWLNTTITSGRKSGALESFFQKTINVTKILIGIFRDFGAALLNVGKAGQGLGLDLLRHLSLAAKSFRDFTESAKGKNVIAQWFKDMHEPILEGFRLISAITKAFFQLGSHPSVGNLFKTIRTQMLPVLVKVGPQVTSAFGPALIGLITNIVRLIGAMAGATGPLTSFVEALSLSVGWLAKFLEANPKFAEFLGYFFIFNGFLKVGVSLLGGIFGPIVKFTKLITDLAPAFGVLQKAVAGLNLAFLSSPAFWIVVGLVALGVALYVMYKKVKWFRDAVNWMWDALKAVFGWIKSNWPLLLAILIGPLGIATYLIIKNFKRIKATVGDVLQWIRNAFNNTINFFARLPGRIANATRGMWDGIKWAFKHALNWIIEKWNKLHFTIGGWKVKKGPISISLPKINVGLPPIPMLASGGNIASGGLAMVGERGPEILALPAGASVAPINQPAVKASGNVSPVFSSADAVNGRPEIIQLVVDSRVLAEVTNRRNSDRKART